jgi:hypothetical protein
MKILFLLLFSLFCFANDKILLHIDFKGLPDTQDATKILLQKGFEFQLQKDDFKFSIKDEKLYIETDKEAAVLFGKILHGKKELKNPAYAVIEWGVERFSEGAEWEKGNNRLPIGVILVFGMDKLRSGMPLLAPRVPTFLCPFIGEKEKLMKVYLGKLYKKGGRYYCVSNEGGGKLVKTRFDIAKHYFKEFGKEVPPLTAFAFQVNTNNTQGGAKSFIKSFTLYAK